MVYALPRITIKMKTIVWKPLTIKIIKFLLRNLETQTPEEVRWTYQPKRCGNNNKDEDNSPKTLNDKNYCHQFLKVFFLFRLHQFINISQNFSCELHADKTGFTRLLQDQNVFPGKFSFKNFFSKILVILIYGKRNCITFLY